METVESQVVPPKGGEDRVKYRTFLNEGANYAAGLLLAETLGKYGPAVDMCTRGVITQEQW